MADSDNTLDLKIKLTVTGKEEAEGLQEHLSGLADLMEEAGPKAAELGKLLRLAPNPALLAGAGLAEGLKAYFEWLEKVQAKYHDLIADGQKVNDVLHDIVAARPT